MLLKDLCNVVWSLFKETDVLLLLNVHLNLVTQASL